VYDVSVDKYINRYSKDIRIEVENVTRIMRNVCLRENPDSDAMRADDAARFNALTDEEKKQILM